MSFKNGETIGQYQIIEQLGQGGMATVFKAYHPSLDRYVAIKALHLAFREDPNFLARFQREAKVVARLEHQNIVPIYDFSEHEGTPFLVMKFIDGETLKSRLSRGSLSKGEIVAITRSIGSALDYAHRQNILHRDVKPSNVLLATDGQIYLADFGLARIAQSGESTLTGDMMVGTPQYISPEQALSEKNLDARTDIYSFCVLLYELVVGRVPYNADTPFSVIHDHIYTPLPLPRQVNPAVSEAVQRVLLKGLAKNPNDRYASVNEMVAAFCTAMIEEPAGVPLPPSMSNTQAVPSPVPSDINSASTQHVLPNPDLKRKPKWIFLAVGGVGILIMVIIGLIFLQGRNAARNNKLSANATQVPIVANSKEGPSLTNKNYDEAMKLINQATDQLQQGQPGRAMITFQKLNNLGLVDNKVFDDAMSQFYQQKNWTAAAMFLFSTSSGEMLEIAKTKLEMVHEILYLAAEQKDADQIFSKLPDRPIFVVSKIRHELYYGDPATAKRQLGDVLGKPALLKESPEAKTLEVEIFIKLNDLANAKKKLQPLLNDTSLPVWVQGVVDELNKKIKS